MVILVIGPSGVGKSDYGKHVEVTIPGCQFFDLDSLVREHSGTPASQLLPRIGNDAFLDRCRQEVDALMQSCTENVVIVAVGAGALQSGHAGAWLSRHQGPTVAVVAAPDEVYRRGGKRNRGRTLDQFTATEYSQHRQSLYETAKYQCCVTGLTVEEARNRFIDLIRNLATNSNRETIAQPTRSSRRRARGTGRRSRLP
jgi:shikimate kinase